MTNAGARPIRCSYVVPLTEPRATEDLVELSRYLSDLQVAGCDVVILDSTAPAAHARHRRVLRWVSRIEGVQPRYRTPYGDVDILRAAAERAGHEKVLIAEPEVRFDEQALVSTLALLDTHESVEPQEYIAPLPWWAAVDAAHALLKRGLEPEPNDSATFAFRRSTVRLLRDVREQWGMGYARRFAAAGGEVLTALDLFVQRRPEGLQDWAKHRSTLAAAEFDSFPRAAAFIALLPLLLVVALTAGSTAAAGLAAFVSVLTISVALRGRAGAVHAFPFRAALLAPVWLFERSIVIYVAMVARLRRQESQPEIATGNVAQKAASGE